MREVGGRRSATPRSTCPVVTRIRVCDQPLTTRPRPPARRDRLPRARADAERGSVPSTMLRRREQARGNRMQAVVTDDRDAGLAGLSLAELPYPHAAENDVVVRVHAAGMTPRGAGVAGDLVGPRGSGPDAERPRARGVRRRRRAGLRDDRPDGRPAGVRPDGLGAQRDAGRVRRGGGAQPRATPGGRRPHRGRRVRDLRADGVAGPVRPRPRRGRSDRLVHGAAGGVGSVAVQLAGEAGAA